MLVFPGDYLPPNRQRIFHYCGSPIRRNESNLLLSESWTKCRKLTLLSPILKPRNEPIKLGKLLEYAPAWMTTCLFGRVIPDLDTPPKNAIVTVGRRLTNWANKYGGKTGGRTTSEKLSVTLVRISILRSMKHLTMPDLIKLYGRLWSFEMTTCTVLFHEQKKEKMDNKEKENDKKQRQRMKTLKHT
uniref:Uncharacterized protein n=1 Tax=Romanomermis culicivorax TaxID=13658 RepID=A0A915HKM6_ROMCU